ncbi:diguanylate cyclase [Cryobacterium algoritolerans]|uniref:Diguanylate cyclase n=1 Tax=Cryobacterium algoritolerans TaxID=1259184 RepID=A0A4V3IE18_9MICO|nr:GGDEF domain-containing protein [Cryobacterium algoritolerans]TFC10398.1 diguanylate cyclase [Cryobacterium algoritolerans]
MLRPSEAISADAGVVDDEVTDARDLGGLDDSGIDDTGTTLERMSEFGPFDYLADRAHRLYLSGYSDRAVRACRAWAPVTRSAGDRATTRFLCYIEGVALQELGRDHEGVTVAMDLLSELDDDPDPLWRAKALALLAQSSIQVKEVSRAMDALAEGTWLVAIAPPGSYSHLSASTAVALALRAVFLFEQADELMSGIRLGEDWNIDLLVVQERALLSAFWGTTLLVVGRADEAGPHLVRCADQALRMRRTAELADDPEMSARAEVIEAYALSRLGYTALAAARVNAATQRFRLREDLVETHLARLVLGQAATESGDFAEARRQLCAALAAADRARREIWAAAAVESLADLDVAEHGEHPAIDLWKRLAREALERVWVERDGRFTALQTRNQVRALTAETSRMGEAALLDPLTGLGNRHMMTSTVDRAGADLSAVFVDVDEFKQVNDRFSHAVGDEVLRRIAVILRTHCRSDDIPVRYGGDEFVILVFGEGAAANGVAARLHEAVRNAPWGQVAPRLTVTVSVGVGRAAPTRGAIAAADAALYEAKRAGRDRVVTA